MTTDSIEAIETAKVPPRWGLVRIQTAQGLTGFGEFTLEGQLATTESAVREAVGPEVDIAFDFHGRANVPMARRSGKGA